jgi:hypothetical protein
MKQLAQAPTSATEGPFAVSLKAKKLSASSPKFSDKYFRGSVLQIALDVTKKTVHARAVKERWPWRKRFNWFEYRVPAEMEAICTEIAADTAAGIKAQKEQSSGPLFRRLCSFHRIGRHQALRFIIAECITEEFQPDFLEMLTLRRTGRSVRRTKPKTEPS